MSASLHRRQAKGTLAPRQPFPPPSAGVGPSLPCSCTAATRPYGLSLHLSLDSHLPATQQGRAVVCPQLTSLQAVRKVWAQPVVPSPCQPHRLAPQFPPAEPGPTAALRECQFPTLTDGGISVRPHGHPQGIPFPNPNRCWHHCPCNLPRSGHLPPAASAHTCSSTHSSPPPLPTCRRFLNLSPMALGRFTHLLLPASSPLTMAALLSISLQA